MIPVHLRISGFLSYRDAVELDFTSFDLACISGPNGAGKSGLLDAITWALFGQARKRDESIINQQARAAEVVFTFRYEDALYRVQRSLARGKTPALEFQVLIPAAVLERAAPGSSPGAGPPSPRGSADVWRALTDRTLRDTQARIEEALRLDYDTFVNASFFLQGRADQFAQQSPGKRKEVLTSILGLETWESYRSRTAEARRALEDEITAVDGRTAEITAELAEEVPRRQQLARLELELQGLAAARKTQEVALDSVRKAAASLEQERALIEALADSLERARSYIASLRTRLAERESLRGAGAELTGRAIEINAAYAAWRQAQAALEQWEGTAAAFREHEQGRLPLLEQIASERARLEEEQRGLLNEQQEVELQADSLRELESELQHARQRLAQADARALERARLEAELAVSRQTHAALKAENDLLKIEMDSLKGRIDTLGSADGAACPLCGQPLTARHRKSTLKTLGAEGKERGNRFRANKSAADELVQQIARFESESAALSAADDERLQRSVTVAQLAERLSTLHSLVRSWRTGGLKRLKALDTALQRGKFAPEAQAQLGKLDKELSRLGYDVGAHDRARQTEQDSRSADEEHRRLEFALAALAPLQSEIENLQAEILNRDAELAVQESEIEAARLRLGSSGLEAPDLVAAERALFDLQEQENRLNQEVGAARQKVSVLHELQVRGVGLESARQALALQISRHKLLERAFGRDGVPALLIEQALPEIESKANELLGRLSDGRMSVRFVTQAGYKDRKREDLKETLEIQISDGVGTRDYEMYSGGEAFRINFAVRLALSEVLAARKGARLQTLVIDEGFGSQDLQGRQRLIEAINLVRHDFAMILVITHLDELKDAFPTRIEVEKTESGSMARVV